MDKKHNCFNCNNENTLHIYVRTGSGMDAFTIRDGAIRVEPTFIGKDKVEVEYNCSNCRNKNKITIPVK